MDPYPSITLGNNASATQTVGPFSSSTNSPELTGLLNSSLVAGANPRADANSLLYFLNGFVSQASQFYFIKNFTNIADNRWDDYSTAGIRMRNQIHGEWSGFVSFRISESKRVLIRVDSTNVLNHPTPSTPSFAASTFGLSTGKNGERSPGSAPHHLLRP